MRTCVKIESWARPIRVSSIDLKLSGYQVKRSFECSFSNYSTIEDLNFFFFFTLNSHKNRVFFGLMKPLDTPFSCKGAGRFPVHVAVNMGSLPLVPGK